MAHDASEIVQCHSQNPEKSEPSAPRTDRNHLPGASTGSKT
jgi:hypothetical protein